jgi:hypothetical protein
VHRIIVDTSSLLYDIRFYSDQEDVAPVAMDGELIEWEP